MRPARANIIHLLLFSICMVCLPFEACAITGKYVKLELLPGRIDFKLYLTDKGVITYIENPIRITNKRSRGLFVTHSFHTKGSHVQGEIKYLELRPGDDPIQLFKKVHKKLSDAELIVAYKGSANNRSVSRMFYGLPGGEYEIAEELFEFGRYAVSLAIRYKLEDGKPSKEGDLALRTILPLSGPIVLFNE